VADWAIPGQIAGVFAAGVRLQHQIEFEIRMDKPVLPISEFAARADFPQCAVGEAVDIGGYVGTVVEIVHNSIRVRSPEGVTRGFNFYTLRKLYGPRPEPEMAPYPAVIEKEREARPEAEPDPVESEIENPDFNREPKPIAGLLADPAFPASALGEMVDVGGYTGVIVQVFNQSLKVRSREGTSRRYNADALRKLHGKK
jgi:hypothetical protein